MELTQKGKDKLKEVTPAVSKLHRGLLTTMGDMELEGFEKVLRKMEVFFEDYILPKNTCETTKRVTRMFRL